jgi:hypothetical protein
VFLLDLYQGIEGPYTCLFACKSAKNINNRNNNGNTKQAVLSDEVYEEEVDKINFVRRNMYNGHY